MTTYKEGTEKPCSRRERMLEQKFDKGTLVGGVRRTTALAAGEDFSGSDRFVSLHKTRQPLLVFLQTVFTVQYGITCITTDWSRMAAVSIAGNSLPCTSEVNSHKEVALKSTGEGQQTDKASHGTQHYYFLKYARTIHYTVDVRIPHKFSLELLP